MTWEEFAWKVAAATLGIALSRVLVAGWKGDTDEFRSAGCLVVVLLVGAWWFA